LWHTWFDRDLSLSGKVLVRDSGSDKVSSRLVQFRDPVARISNLAIHLQTADERAAFKVNKEDHTIPVIAMEAKDPEGANGTPSPPSDAAASVLEQEAASQLQTATTDGWHEGHEPLLLRRIADELRIGVSEIADVDLSLYDTQPACVGGMHREFLYSGRLDNLATVFCAVEALAHHATSGNLESDPNVSMIVCFDHEEVGSVSSHGAGSPVLKTAVDRISEALMAVEGGSGGGASRPTADLAAATVQNSFVLSVDQAHAAHPNYSSKHEAQHSPLLNHGVVIKTNSNQRYTTNSLTGFVVRELGRKAGVPLQEFCGAYGLEEEICGDVRG
jgi:aspartyl aminopeptidase